MINEIFGVWNYWIVFTLMMIGLYIVISKKSLLKKVVGLAIFQTSVFLLYITFGKIAGGAAPGGQQGGYGYGAPPQQQPPRHIRHRDNGSKSRNDST